MVVAFEGIDISLEDSVIEIGTLVAREALDGLDRNRHHRPGSQIYCTFIVR